MQQDYNVVQQQQQYHHTEEQMLCEVTSKARWNRSKSCHSRSNSLKRSKSKLAPDEDLITVVTDEPHHGHHGHHGHHVHHFAHDSHSSHHPQPKPRTILTQVHRNGSASLGNILIIDPDQYLIDQSGGDHHFNPNNANETEKTLRQTLPRRHQQPPQSPDQLFPLENLQHSPGGALTSSRPKPSPRSSSYHRHPLSHSTETILYTDDRYDPNPIIPNSTPDVPDIWLPMRSVKA
jgi:hypothetical protein